MSDPIHPPRLARGGHEFNSGYGCAMNSLAWQRYAVDGCTDPSFPPHVDRGLANLVQVVNDLACPHGEFTADHVYLLCPSCSVRVLELAHRVADTAGASAAEHWRFARSVLAHLAEETSHASVAEYLGETARLAEQHARGHPVAAAAPVDALAAEYEGELGCADVDRCGLAGLVRETSRRATTGTSRANIGINSVGMSLSRLAMGYWQVGFSRPLGSFAQPHREVDVAGRLIRRAHHVVDMWQSLHRSPEPVA